MRTRDLIILAQSLAILFMLWTRQPLPQEAAREIAASGRGVSRAAPLEICGLKEGDAFARCVAAANNASRRRIAVRRQMEGPVQDCPPSNGSSSSKISYGSSGGSGRRLLNKHGYEALRQREPRSAYEDRSCAESERPSRFSCSIGCPPISDDYSGSMADAQPTCCARATAACARLDWCAIVVMGVQKTPWHSPRPRVWGTLKARVDVTPGGSAGSSADGTASNASSAVAASTSPDADPLANITLRWLVDDGGDDDDDDEPGSKPGRQRWRDEPMDEALAQLRKPGGCARLPRPRAARRGASLDPGSSSRDGVGRRSVETQSVTAAAAAAAARRRRDEAPLLFSRTVALDVSRLLLVYMHVPKCAGSSFFTSLKLTCRNVGIVAAEQLRWWPPYPLGSEEHIRSYRAPKGFEQASYIAPGCAFNTSSGAAAHCSHAELRSCVMGGHAVHRPPLPPGGTAERTPLFVTVIREPVARVISEFAWGTQRWCTAELVDTPWNPWPADLCRGLLDGSNRTTSLARWVAAPNNPAHNRQASFRAADNPGNPTASFLAADAAAPIVHRERLCLFSHVRLPRAWRLGDTTDAARWDLRAALNDDRRVAERAWCTLRHEYWFVGVLGPGLALADSLAAFELLLRHGAPRPPAPPPPPPRSASPCAEGTRGNGCRDARARRRHSQDVENGGSGGGAGDGSDATGAARRPRTSRGTRGAASSPPGVRPGSGDAKRRYGNSLHHSGGAGRDQVGTDLLAEIARRNQADLLLYRAARREFELLRADAQRYLEPPLHLATRNDLHAKGGSLDDTVTHADDGLSDAQREEIAAERREAQRRATERARERRRARRTPAAAEDDG